MPGGNTVKIGIVVVCLTAAVLVLVLTRGAESPRVADGVEITKKDLICTSCNHHWEVPIAEWDALLATTEKRPVESEGRTGPRTRQQAQQISVLACQKCNEKAAVLAAKCPDSDTWYPTVNMDGSKGKCPD